MHQRFDHFEHGGYSTGESPPIKAGHRELLPHLESTCTRFNTSARRRTRPSAGPERCQLLQILPSLTVRQFYFSCCANISRSLVFPVRQCFCRRQYFSMRQGFGIRQGFSLCQCFCTFFLAPIFLCILPAFLFRMRQ